jgi:acyl dehydratase
LVVAGGWSVDGLYFEDFPQGRVFDTPGITLTEAAIIDFASRYDPQPFHLDREAAAQSMFEGLVASGFHTLCLSFRLFTQLNLLPNNLGGPGLDGVRWLKPVRPGDTIRCRVTVAEARPSSSKPDRGIITWGFETLNQDGAVVMTALSMSFLKRRKGRS